MQITDHFRGIIWNIPQFNKGNAKRCQHVTDRLDLGTLGYAQKSPWTLRATSHTTQEP